MKSLVLSILQFFQFGKIARLAIEDEKRRTCENAVVSGEGVRFGPSAVVHNLPDRRERIRIGKHTLIDGELLVHDYGGSIEIGDFTYIGLGSRVWSGELVRIGNHVLVAHNVNITDTNSHQFDSAERKEHYLRTTLGGETFQKGSIQTSSVVIEDHVWINFGVGILKGVRIGEGAVIGAMSLVTKDVPPYTLVAGNPARVIRSLM